MDTLIIGVSTAGTAPARPGSGIATVIPARDEGLGLEAALRSVERQTQVPDRLIVVVNNSTDDTEQVARNYARGQRRLPIDVLVMPDSTDTRRRARWTTAFATSSVKAPCRPRSVTCWSWTGIPNWTRTFSSALSASGPR